MKKLFLLLTSLISFAQSNQPTPLYVYNLEGITSDTIIDNRNTTNRYLTYVSAACTGGGGSYGVSLEYSSVSTGPWTSYGTSATIDQTSNPPIATGFLYTPPNYIRVNITSGTPSCKFSGSQKLYVNPSVDQTVTENGSLNPLDYNFSQTPNSNIVVGSNTVTLTPCPGGVNGSDTHHSVRISGGVGTAETVLITGGTCTSLAASGTIIFTAQYTHSGGYTISSASDGLQEVVNLTVSTNRLITIPYGTLTMDPVAPGEESTVYVQSGINITGFSASSNILVSGNQYAIVIDTIYAVNFEKFQIEGSSMTGGGGIKLTATSGFYPHNCYSTFENMTFIYNYIALDIVKGCVPRMFGNNFFDWELYAIKLQNTYCTDCGDQFIADNNFQTSNSGTTGIRWETGGGLKVSGNKFNMTGTAIDVASTDPIIIFIVTGNSFDNPTVSSIKIRAPVGDSVDFVNITGNTFTGTGGGSYVAIDVGAATDSIANLVISGNNIGGTGTGISLGNVDTVMIAGNNFAFFTTGILVTSDATQVSLGKNNFNQVTTPFSIASGADITPVSPSMASGYLRDMSSNVNIKSIFEFQQGTSGPTANNGILFGTPATGTTSQHGLWWANNGTDLNLARFDSARVATPTTDVVFLSDGTVQFNSRVGIKKVPDSSLALDVNGEIRSIIGTVDLRLQAGCAGAACVGTFSNDPLIMYSNSAERWRISTTGLLSSSTAGISSKTYETASNCSDSSGAAACGSAVGGSFVIDAGSTSTVVSTTSITGNSQIFVNFDSSLGSRLGITCNTTYAAPIITSRSASTSFTVSVGSAPVTNAACYSFFIVN